MGPCLIWYRGQFVTMRKYHHLELPEAAADPFAPHPIDEDLSLGTPASLRDDTTLGERMRAGFGIEGEWWAIVK